MFACVLTFVLQLASVLHAQDLDIISDRTGCYLVQNDGTEKKVDCTTLESNILSSKDKKKELEMLKRFELSKQAQFLKERSISQNSNQTILSDEALYKSKFIREGKLLATICFLSDKEYPSKSNKTQNYWKVSRVNGYKVLGDEFTAKWDHIISRDLIGRDYEKYRTSVLSVYLNKVVVAVEVENSDQLANIIDGKRVKFINHAGQPIPTYEEITPF